ncbi:diguanylate cyclase domain-containing protein [Paenibacillus sp. MBLB4367]|uniref:diguanylate cyclase domain-containing protein n=1 Tax=Paenibacillus sp. MBLB4367 TaxID=3384767 RepID=UPI003907EAE3
MDGKIATKNAERGYAMLIGLMMVQQLLIYLNVYLDQSYTAVEIGFSIAALSALLAGFIVPLGVAVVGVFVFVISYLVWLVTYAHADVLTVTWLLLIPANGVIAAFVKSHLIRNKRVMERLDELKDTNPQMDLDTSLMNKEALADMVVKQSNLAKRYTDRYGFSMAMFKIEFLPLVLESLGSVLYAQLLLELSQTIQKQLRFEDYKFSIDEGRFIILCPMTDRDYFDMVTDRIKQAMMNVSFTGKNGQELKLIVRTGAIAFRKEQFGQYQRIDDVIAALERGTETDLVAEYV